MALDPIVNFGKVTVSTGYDASATSIALNSGDGANLPSTFSYNLVWWDSTTYADPADDPNVEIVRVTNRVTDTLTVARAQEGTSASTKNTATKTYRMILAFTKKMFDDLPKMLHVNTTAVGTDADTLEKDLMTYSLPANTLSANGKGVRIYAIFSTAANGNTKTMKLYFGNLVIHTDSAAFNNSRLPQEGLVFRSGIGTQRVFDIKTAPIILAGIEDETATIIIKLTGQNGVASANDIWAELLMVELLN